MISVPGCISSSPAQTTILLLRSCQTTLYDRPTAPDVKQEDDEWVPAYAQSTPRIEQKSSGGRRKENNETTPAMKAGVGDVLQISTWMNSDSILGDCRTGELAVIKVGVESVLCEQLLVSPLLDDRTMVHDKDVVSVSDGREPVGNILTDRAVEKPGILEDHTKHGAQTSPAYLPGLDAVERDGATLDVVETHEQIDKCGLACSGRSDNGNGVALLDIQIHIRDQGFGCAIAEVDMIKRDGATRCGDDDRVARIRLLLGFVEHREHSLCACHRRLNDVGDARRL